MLNTIPTNKKLAELNDQLQRGQTLLEIAADLRRDPQFRKVYPQGNDGFAEKVLEVLFNSDVVNRSEIKSYILNRIAVGITESTIIVEIINYIADYGYSYPSTLDKLVNKYNLAKYYNDTIGTDIYLGDTSAILNKITNNLNSLTEAKLLIDDLRPINYTLDQAINIGISNLKLNIKLFDANIDLGEGTISEISRKIETIKQILNRTTNIEEIVFLPKYKLKDSIENLANNSNEIIVKNSNSYSLNNVNKDLGVISAYQANIVNNSINSNEFLYFNSDILLNEAALILKRLGFTILQAKRYFLDNVELIEMISPLLKEAKLTVNMVIAILKSSTSTGDISVDISADQVRTLFKGYVADIYGTSANSKILGTSSNNLIEGTDASELIEGKEGEDTVVYNGRLADYNINKLYIGKSGEVNKYSITKKTSPTNEDKINSDIEYILLRDEGLRLPTSGTLIIGTESKNNISGTDLNDIIYAGEGDDVIKGGTGVDGVVYPGSIQQYQITKLYAGKNNSLSGYKIKDKTGVSGTDELSIDVEQAYFLDSVINLSSYEPDLTPPRVKITADKTHLKYGESVKVDFDFNEDVTGFRPVDINLEGGRLSDFTGFGSHYSAVFTNSSFRNGAGNISIKNKSLIDKSGNEFILSIDKDDDLDLLLDLKILTDTGLEPNLNLINNNGNDLISIMSHTILPGLPIANPIINGGLGLDTVVLKESSVVARISGDKDLRVEIRSSLNNVDINLISIERIQFTDVSKAYDVSNFSIPYNETTNPGNAGLVARILYSILGPDTVRLPLFVGVGLKQIEELGKTPVELATIAAELKLGSQYQFSDLLYLIYSNIKSDINLSEKNWVKEAINKYYTPSLLFQEIIYDQVFSGLVGIQSLDYYPQ